jgi:hypothetical protein
VHGIKSHLMARMAYPDMHKPIARCGMDSGGACNEIMV